MRFCDFMVDHLGEWDVVTCNGDNVDWSFKVTNDDWISVTGREMQMVFRAQARRWSRPHRWCVQARCSGSAAPTRSQVLASCEPKRHCGPYGCPRYGPGTDLGAAVAGRNIQEQRPHVTAAGAWPTASWRRWYCGPRTPCSGTSSPSAGGMSAVCVGDLAEFVVPKTVAACPELAQRCQSKGSNPANQTYLLHGTSPTSALFILENSFKVDLAGVPPLARCSALASTWRSPPGGGRAHRLTTLRHDPMPRHGAGHRQRCLLPMCPQIVLRG